MSLNTSMNALLHGMDAQRISIQPQRCISVRNRNAACQRCVDACATGALYRQGDDVRVDASKCIGCGTCASACPTAAITLACPSQAQVAAAAKASLVAFGGQTMFCCAQAAQDAGLSTAALEQAHVCVLPCLGHVDESLLAEQAARRARRVNVIHGDCSACEHVKGGALCEEVCQSTQRLLQAFGNECVIDFTADWPQAVLKAAAQVEAEAQAADPGECENGAAQASAQPVPLFSSVADADAGNATSSSAAAAASTDGSLDDPASLQGLYTKVGNNGTLSHHIPLKRTRLFNCLKHLGQPQETEVETRLVGRVDIDTSKCMSCRMCSVFCPTGALLQEGSPANEDEPFGLLHRPTLCMQCRCCEQICAKDAITVTGKLPLKQFLGKEEVFLELPRPQWLPNTPESMYDKFADMIGRDKNTGHF